MLVGHQPNTVATSAGGFGGTACQHGTIQRSSSKTRARQHVRRCHPNLYHKVQSNVPMPRFGTEHEILGFVGPDAAELTAPDQDLIQC